jgi:hypothetical protein
LLGAPVIETSLWGRQGNAAAGTLVANMQHDNRVNTASQVDDNIGHWPVGGNSSSSSSSSSTTRKVAICIEYDSISCKP